MLSYPLCGRMELFESGPEAEEIVILSLEAALPLPTLGVYYIGMNEACGKFDFNGFIWVFI